MLWQKTDNLTSSGSPIWVAVDEAGVQIRDAEGKYTTRYDPLAGAAYYTTRHAIVDKSATPEVLPDGWPAESREGIIVRFCFTPEARRDWAFLDAWGRRRKTSITHAGCGGNGQWPEIQQRVPLACPKCGPLRGDENLYAQWYTVKDPGGESVKACVFEAWLTGKRHDYLLGRRPVPARPIATSSFARFMIGLGIGVMFLLWVVGILWEITR